jgi:hypothetical protein
MATQEQLLKENTRALIELTKLLKEQVDKEEAEAKAGEDPKTDIQKERNKAIEEGNKLLAERKEIEKELKDAQSEIFNQRKKSRLEYEAGLKREAQLLRKLKKASGERKKLLKEQLAAVREITDEYEKQESGFSKLKDSVGKFTKRVGEAYRGIKQMSTALNTMAKDFAEFDANVLTLDSAKKAGFNLDQLSVELKKSTGLGGDFVKRIQEIDKDMAGFGMTSEDTKQTFVGLFNSVSDFSRLTKDTQTDLTQTAFKFTKLGISVEDTSKILELGTKTLGMSTEGTMELQESLAQTAIAIGVSPQRMVQGFATAAPRLAAHGRNMEKVFKGLALQSKATGLSIEGLIGIAQGFDTFESAAQKTAQLNAMFGTQLNSVQLLNATEEERIDLIKQSLAATGKSVDQHGRFEVKSLAQILGTDDESVRRMLGATDEIFADLEGKAAEAGEVDLEKQILESVSAQEQLNAARQRDAEFVGETIIPQLRDMAKFQATNEEHVKGMAKAAELAAGSFNFLFEKAKAARPILNDMAGATAALDLTDKTVGTGMSFLGGAGTVLGSMGVGALLNKLTMPGGGAGGGGMLSRLKGLIPGGGAAGTAGGAGSGGGMLSRVGGFFKGGGAVKLLRGAGAAGGVLTTGMGISDIFTKKGVAQGKGASNAIKGMMLTAGSVMGPSGTPLLIGSGVIELLQSFGADTKIADYIYDTFGGGTGEDLTNVGTMFKAAPTPNAPSVTPSATQAQSSAQIMNTRTSQTASNLPDKIILSVDGQQFSAKIVKEGLNSLKKVGTLN